MKQQLTASIWREGDWFVAQGLEVDVASQGQTEDEALANLREALELYSEPPTPPAGTSTASIHGTAHEPSAHHTTRGPAHLILRGAPTRARPTFRPAAHPPHQLHCIPEQPSTGRTPLCSSHPSPH